MFDPNLAKKLKNTAVLELIFGIPIIIISSISLYISLTSEMGLDYLIFFLIFLIFGIILTALGDSNYFKYRDMIGKPKYDPKMQAGFYLILAACGFFIMLSTFLPWDTYLTMNTLLIWQFTGQLIPIVKTFTPLNWVWADIVPVFSFFPLAGGFLLLIGMVFYILEYNYGKRIMIFGPLLSISIYALYIFLFWIIPVLYETFAGGMMFWFEEYRIPNEFGAYLSLIPGIISIPFMIKIRMPEREKEEPKAFKIAKVAVPWKKEKTKKGEQFCAQCGAVIKEGEAFCNQCGTYF